MIINAEGQVLGRLASEIAQKLLDGEKVKVVNSKEAIITGDSESIIEKYNKRKGAGDPKHGPYYPTKPENILRRTIRGMLPMKKAKGKEAYKNLKAFPKNPLDEEGSKLVKMKEDVTTNYITLGKLSQSIGGEKNG